MSHNGYNVHQKAGLGSVKIGRYVCPCCDSGFEEKREFWERLMDAFFDVISQLFTVLRDNTVSYKGISDVMALLYPRGKDTIMKVFSDKVEQTEIPPVEEIKVVHYDEQHPKRGRSQKYRLTLLDGSTGRPIADELYDDKCSKTIRNFLAKHLDPNKPIFLVTDLAPSYAHLFKEFFGENLTHQHCLLHLNKLIVKDFPQHTTLAQEYLKYQLLDIFYNRTPELEFLEQLLKEELLLGRTSKTNAYLRNKEQLAVFKSFLHEQELSRRRNRTTLEQRTHIDSLNKFDSLFAEIGTYDETVQKRLRMIRKDWKLLTAFHSMKGAPATNNKIENYYSATLKTHRKKQFRTDRGIENQMKLGHMKRARLLVRSNETLLDAFINFIPFMKPG